jgi:trigger factor
MPRQTQDLHEARLEFRLKSHPMTQSLDRPRVELPTVTAPSLDDLVVEVQGPHEPTPVDIALRLREIADVVAPSVARKPQEPVAAGDQVCLSIVGYVGDRLIPFSARERAWMALRPEPVLPGFFEALVGKPVAGAPLRIPVRLPSLYPVEALRGADAWFGVEILAAQATKPPPIDDASFLLSLSKGDTVSAVREAIADDLRELAASHALLRAQEAVLDEIVRRAQVDVPEPLIDEEIRRRWMSAEGELLARRGFNGEQLSEAQEGWVKDPATRKDVRRRLAISLTLRAIAERDHVQVTPEQVKELIQTASKTFGGQEVADPAEALAGEEKAAEQVANVAFFTATVAHVMNHARVNVLPASENAPRK